MNAIISIFFALFAIGQAQLLGTILRGLANSSSTSPSPSTTQCPINPTTTPISFKSAAASCQNNGDPIAFCGPCLCALTSAYIPAFQAANISTAGLADGTFPLDQATAVIQACSIAYLDSALAANISIAALGQLASVCNFSATNFPPCITDLANAALESSRNTSGITYRNDSGIGQQVSAAAGNATLVSATPAPTGSTPAAAPTPAPVPAPDSSTSTAPKPESGSVLSSASPANDTASVTPSASPSMNAGSAFPSPSMSTGSTPTSQSPMVMPKNNTLSSGADLTAPYLAIQVILGALTTLALLL